jgi:hypothetical protein
MSTTTIITNKNGWQEMMMFSNANNKKDDDLLSESSHSEAAQVYQTWQSEDEDMWSCPGVVSDEEDDDIIMQLEEDEGLLPSSLDDFYDNITTDISADDTINFLLSSSSSSSSQDTPAPVSPMSYNATYNNCSGDSFFSVPSVEDDKARFQATVGKLAESMRRSQETRRSLYARTPGLRDYKRLGSVERVLQSVEFSSLHVDSYCKAIVGSPSSQ